MYLVDTNVISEQRKGLKANLGALAFLDRASYDLYLPSMVVGELCYGVESLKRKHDVLQAKRLEVWLETILKDFAKRLLPFDERSAQVWGKMMDANSQHIVDKQIAAIALVYDLTVVTRNTDDFVGTGVRLLNPFTTDAIETNH